MCTEGFKQSVIAGPGTHWKFGSWAPAQPWCTAGEFLFVPSFSSGFVRAPQLGFWKRMSFSVIFNNRKEFHFRSLWWNFRSAVVWKDIGLVLFYFNLGDTGSVVRMTWRSYLQIDHYNKFFCQNGNTRVSKKHISCTQDLSALPNSLVQMLSFMLRYLGWKSNK